MSMRNSVKGVVILACAVSLFPYLIPDVWYSLDRTRGFHFPIVALDFLWASIWLILVLLALKMSDWDRKLFWLFALFPVACGPLLLMGYLFLQWTVSGFAP
jgi:hypothetical protein